MKRSPGGGLPATPAPILIGITGKRIFSSDPAGNEAIERRLGAHLDQVFQTLERRFPGAPKVLLTGAAAGTDIVAAERALEAGGNWSVALILPFAPALFVQDFEAADPANTAECQVAAARRERLQVLMNAALRPDGAPRVLMKVLPPLAGPDGIEAGPHQLERAAGDRGLRRNHYEQVGQFIAETALLLIAVLAGTPEPCAGKADGSTARIIAYRRGGKPDAAGADVARRSAVLQRRWDGLQPPPADYVWLLQTADPAPRGGRLQVLCALPDYSPELLYEDCLRAPDGPESEGENLAHRARHSIGSRLRQAARRLIRTIPHPHARRGRVAESLGTVALLHDFQKVVARVARIEAKAGRSHLPIDTGIVTPVVDPSDYLESLRTAIRPVQIFARKRFDLALGIVAAAFLVAVMSLDCFGRLAGDPWPLLTYLVALGVIAAAVSWARRLRWQNRAEDYRAISEMLRIQRAWWAAGLSEHVGRQNMPGVDRELGRVCMLGRAIVTWVWLRSSWQGGGPPSSEWKLVQSWITQQIGYFRKHQPRRQRRASLLNTTTWFLFAMAGWLAADLLVWMQVSALRELACDAAAWAASAGLPGSAAPTWLVACGISLVLRLGLHDMKLAAVSVTLVLSFAGAASLAFAVLAMIGSGFGEMTPQAMVAAREDIVSAFVLLTATAGALQFLNDKLGYATEALTYRDAFDRFKRAERALAMLTDEATGLPTDPEHYRSLIHDLGALALRENEVWLRAHRERPLSPVW